jgi:hypothetical protein
MKDLPVKTPEQLVTLCLDRAEETGKPDRRSGCRRLHQPPQEQNATSVRPDNHLRADGGKTRSAAQS